MKEFKQSREVIHSPEETDIIEMVRERVKRTIDKYPVSPEVSRFLDTVDFPLLRNLFIQIASRGGISPKDVNFVDRTNIIEWTNGLSMGQYNALENTISVVSTSNPDLYLVDKEKFMAEAIRNDIETYGSVDMRLLHTLIHEESHALSKRKIVVRKKKAENSGVIYPKEVITRSGISCVSGEFHALKDKGNISGVIFDVSGMIKDGKFTVKYFGFCALNEAITEKLAREVMLKYLEASSAPKDILETVRISFENNNGSYKLEMPVLDAIIKRIAERNQQEIRVVWESIINAYLQGDDFEDEDVEQLFSETFGPDFLKELSSLLSGLYMGAEKRREALADKYKLFS